MTEFPETTHPLSLQDLLIDATPDGEYALRILRAFRAKCDVFWRVAGLDEGRTALYEAMNEHQRQRARELDAAIACLEEHGR